MKPRNHTILDYIFYVKLGKSCPVTCIIKSCSNQNLLNEEFSHLIEQASICDNEMHSYMKCLANHELKYSDCKSFAKTYLECRMKANLMPLENLDEIGFAETERAENVTINDKDQLLKRLIDNSDSYEGEYAVIFAEQFDKQIEIGYAQVLAKVGFNIVLIGKNSTRIMRLARDIREVNQIKESIREINIAIIVNIIDEHDKGVDIETDFTADSDVFDIQIIPKMTVFLLQLILQRKRRSYFILVSEPAIYPALNLSKAMHSLHKDFTKQFILKMIEVFRNTNVGFQYVVPLLVDLSPENAIKANILIENNLSTLGILSVTYGSAFMYIKSMLMNLKNKIMHGVLVLRSKRSIISKMVKTKTVL
ncbi:hypothetical protein GJ496_005881 [Pomphorhynchus laevis]|nr:hypothetical protein GJ496_005881 [Pomphorhynchus laevis]